MYNIWQDAGIQTRVAAFAARCATNELHTSLFFALPVDTYGLHTVSPAAACQGSLCYRCGDSNRDRCRFEPGPLAIRTRTAVDSNRDFYRFEPGLLPIRTETAASAACCANNLVTWFFFNYRKCFCLGKFFLTPTYSFLKNLKVNLYSVFVTFSYIAGAV